jgi:hypothetical protein
VSAVTARPEATGAAAGARQGPEALQGGEIGQRRTVQGDGHGVVTLRLVAIGAVGDADDIVSAGHDPLAEQEARRQFEIVAGGAHGQRQWAHLVTGAKPDLQRLLAGQVVAGGAYAVGSDPGDAGAHAAAAKTLGRHQPRPAGAARRARLSIPLLYRACDDRDRGAHRRRRAGDVRTGERRRAALGSEARCAARSTG